MRVIKSGSRTLLRFLPVPRAVGVPFIRSCFVLRQRVAEGSLLWNTLTGELVLLSAEEEKGFDSLPALFGPEMTELAGHRLIVPQNVSEAQAAEQLRALLLKTREAKRVISHYNILPTTCCNARCFYCYESGLKKQHMTEATAERLVDFIAGHRGEERVKLSWFGGEPTVGKPIIDYICRRLNEQGIPFVSDMVSNAYLFDRDLVRHAGEVWKLKSIQITLDGTEQVYNDTKAYVGVKDNPFQRVLRNIGYLLEREIRVDIRLNMDSHNDRDLESLILALSKRFVNRKFLSIYIKSLNEDVGFQPISHDPRERKRLEGRLIELQELLEREGWPQYRASELPSLIAVSCMADDPASIQCTPEGILGKCEDQIDRHTVGTLEQGITDGAMIRWWQQRRAFDECETCPLYPSCGRLLKNCPVKTTKCTVYEKERMLSLYRELMTRNYEKWKKTEADAP